MANCRNCIFWGGNDEDLPQYFVCTHKHSLYTQDELDNGTMGRHCRLWDAYIPLEATEQQIEYAKKWQDMDFDKQPDYHDYFSGMTSLYE